ncbi:cyanobactin biosynthesis system PatB/AcyB/McaB family protein [Anabaena sp. FACHB-1391]|uniref:cyanobactin biosynthesis system PatB/AcyB/McaB family protein n=1 Tax=unclassified Anabaena TaxID=2619674 RepID=UPI00322021D9
MLVSVGGCRRTHLIIKIQIFYSSSYYFLVSIRMDLLHGANYNDPAAFQNRSYQQIKSSCSCAI